MKKYKLLLIQLFFLQLVFSQDSIHITKNSIGVYQSLYNFGWKEVQFSTKSTSIGYLYYFKNFGIGLEINRLQLKKDGLSPIMPYDEWGRKDNLQLYYANVLFSYRFVNFCPLKNLKVEMDFAPSFLVAGENKFYGELDQQTLQRNTYWKSPDRMEYETKFNLYGRIGFNYTLFNRFDLGIATSAYLKYIAPTLMSLPYPFSPGPRQLNKSSFWSISFKCNI